MSLDTYMSYVGGAQDTGVANVGDTEIVAHVNRKPHVLATDCVSGYLYKSHWRCSTYSIVDLSDNPNRFDK